MPEHSLKDAECLNLKGQIMADKTAEEAKYPTLSLAPSEETVKPFNLSDFSLNGSSADMVKQMLEDKFVLGKMAILGQSTAFYSKPNVGKTLLVIWLLCDSIQQGEIDGSKVFYINADDNHKGLVHKLKMAEENGFNMLAPGYQNFKSNELPAYLKQMVAAETARGTVLILDTVKKFTDLMKKDVCSSFGDAVRQFVSHGGTVVMLAHVNKHKSDEGKVVPGGTSDLVDDADCAYTLDVMNEDQRTGIRTVIFENFKSRGDSIREAVYQYNYADGTPYQARFDSIQEMGADERQAAEKAQHLAAILERNKEAIEAIKECIREEVNQKTTLVKEAAARSGISKRKIGQALKDHEGSSKAENQFWHTVVGDKNAHTYHLNYGVE